MIVDPSSLLSIMIEEKPLQDVRVQCDPGLLSYLAKFIWFGRRDHGRMLSGTR